MANDEFRRGWESQGQMPTPRPQEVAFAIRGPITRADLAGLCERVCALLTRGGETVVCDVAGVEPDAVTVDALARLQLAACRRGCTVTLRNASEQLLELVELMGLSNVLTERRSRAVDRSAGRPVRRRGRR
jgi:ABC-type transporter Mla MlaB component